MYVLPYALSLFTSLNFSQLSEYLTLLDLSHSLQKRLFEALRQVFASLVATSSDSFILALFLVNFWLRGNGRSDSSHARGDDLVEQARVNREGIVQDRRQEVK